MSEEGKTSIEMILNLIRNSVEEIRADFRERGVFSGLDMARLIAIDKELSSIVRAVKRFKR